MCGSAYDNLRSSATVWKTLQAALGFEVIPDGGVFHAAPVIEPFARPAFEVLARPRPGTVVPPPSRIQYPTFTRLPRKPFTVSPERPTLTLTQRRSRPMDPVSATLLRSHFSEKRPEWAASSVTLRGLADFSFAVGKPME